MATTAAKHDGANGDEKNGAKNNKSKNLQNIPLLEENKI